MIERATATPVRGHRLERLDARVRAAAAVDPDDIGAGRQQGSRGDRRRRPVGQLELLSEGQLGDDRQVGRPARLVDREEQVRRGSRTSR